VEIKTYRVNYIIVLVLIVLAVLSLTLFILINGGLHAKVATKDLAPFLMAALILMFFTIYAIAAKAQVSDEGIYIRMNLFDKGKFLKWNEISKLQYYNMTLWGHWLYVYKQNKIYFLVNQTYEKHNLLIQDIVANTPKTAEINPRLGTREISQNGTLIVIMWFVGGAILCHIINVITHGGFMNLLNKILGAIGL